MTLKKYSYFCIGFKDHHYLKEWINLVKQKYKTIKYKTTKWNTKVLVSIRICRSIFLRKLVLRSSVVDCSRRCEGPSGFAVEHLVGRSRPAKCCYGFSLKNRFTWTCFVILFFWTPFLNFTIVVFVEELKKLRAVKWYSFLIPLKRLKNI